jgi:hypothetical protein
MKVEELKAAFEQLSVEDKLRFLEETAMPFCRQMMTDPAFPERMMPRCAEMMGRMTKERGDWMQGWMTGYTPGRKR